MARMKITRSMPQRTGATGHLTSTIEDTYKNSVVESLCSYDLKKIKMNENTYEGIFLQLPELEVSGTEAGRLARSWRSSVESL